MSCTPFGSFAEDQSSGTSSESTRPTMRRAAIVGSLTKPVSVEASMPETAPTELAFVPIAALLMLPMVVAYMRRVRVTPPHGQTST